jgi:hypothetical protein
MKTTNAKKVSYRLRPLAPSITIKYPPRTFLAIVVHLKALVNSSHGFNKKLEISYKFAQKHIQELSVGQHARRFSVLGHNIVKKLDRVTSSCTPVQIMMEKKCGLFQRDISMEF